MIARSLVQIGARLEQRQWAAYLLATIVAVIVGAVAAVLPALAAVALTLLVGFCLFSVFKTRLSILTLLVIRASVDVLHDLNFGSFADERGINLASGLALGVFLFGSYYLLANRVNPFDNLVSTAYAGFLAVALTGFLVTDYPLAVLIDFLRAASVLILFSVTRYLFPTKSDSLRVIWAMGLSSIVPIAIGSLQFVGGTGIKTIEGFTRVYATFVVPPVYGSFLVLLIPLAIVLIANTRMLWLRAVYAIWLLFALVNLAATYSRGAWIGATIALIILGVLRFKKLLVALPLVAILLVVIVPQLPERIADLGTDTPALGYGEANTWVWRTKFWQEEVLSLGQDNLLVGSGLGTIVKTLSWDAHNDYIKLFVETGFLGLALYLVVLFGLIRHAWRAWLREKNGLYRDIVLAFLATLAAYAVMSFADNIVLNIVLQWYLWSLAAVVFVIARQQDHSTIVRNAL